MQLPRRILAGLLMALVALLPGISRASPAAGHPAALERHADRHGGVDAPAGHAHAHHAATDCAGHHRRDAPPCRHGGCKECGMACCAPAIVGAPPQVVPTRVSLLRRALPAADRRRDDAARAERLRPPIRL